MSPQSDSGYGLSPVSTIKSAHATARSMSSVRPTLIDVSSQRSVSRLSRLVSGEVSDFYAERSTPSSSPTTEERGARGSPAKTPSPRKTPSLPSVVPSTTQSKGLIFLPVSAPSPDGKSLHRPLPSSTPLTQHSTPTLLRRASNEPLELHPNLLRPVPLPRPRTPEHIHRASSPINLDRIHKHAPGFRVLRHNGEHLRRRSRRPLFRLPTPRITRLPDPACSTSFSMGSTREEQQPSHLDTLGCVPRDGVHGPLDGLGRRVRACPVARCRVTREREVSAAREADEALLDQGAAGCEREGCDQETSRGPWVAVVAGVIFWRSCSSVGSAGGLCRECAGLGPEERGRG